MERGDSELEDFDWDEFDDLSEGDDDVFADGDNDYDDLEDDVFEPPAQSAVSA